ncbi:MAG: hypothetical protein WA981_03485 [Glaciecola sp.]
MSEYDKKKSSGGIVRFLKDKADICKNISLRKSVWLGILKHFLVLSLETWIFTTGALVESMMLLGIGYWMLFYKLYNATSAFKRFKRLSSLQSKKSAPKSA